MKSLITEQKKAGQSCSEAESPKAAGKSGVTSNRQFSYVVLSLVRS